MIRARFEWDKGHIRRFLITGHAGDAPQGENIACAAVSSAVMLGVNAAEETAGVPMTVTVLENHIEALFTAPYDLFADRMFLALRDHLITLGEDFPGTIRVISMEVEIDD